jgi:hypothetical protein
MLSERINFQEHWSSCGKNQLEDHHGTARVYKCHRMCGCGWRHDPARDCLEGVAHQYNLDISPDISPLASFDHKQRLIVGQSCVTVTDCCLHVKDKVRAPRSTPPPREVQARQSHCHTTTNMVAHCIESAIDLLILPPPCSHISND